MRYSEIVNSTQAGEGVMEIEYVLKGSNLQALDEMFLLLLDMAKDEAITEEEITEAYLRIKCKYQ